LMVLRARESDKGHEETKSFGTALRLWLNVMIRL